jgi:Domain of unknown function (DUF4365)
MKTYSTQAEIGEAGIALIDRLVTGMGFLWHPRRVDHGIDGEIELVDTVTRQPLNRVVFVQSKASSQPFPGENDKGFHYDASPDDLEYWNQANVPVIVVCSHPGSDDAWWAPSSRARNESGRRTWRIHFDKERDRLSKENSVAILNLERPSDRANAVRSSARKERLVSNLLTIERLADTIWVAPTWLRKPAEAASILRSQGTYCGDWILSDEMLFSFTNPLESPLKALVDGAPDGLETSEWATSKDPDIRRKFVRLLNNVLIDSRSASLRRHKDGYLHVRPTPDLSPLRVKVGRSSQGRTAFERYVDKTDVAKVRHYRHYSVRADFVRFDHRWFAELQPSYHYTFDGYREVPWSNDLRTGIKKLERNDAVRHLTEFWAGYLGPDSGLFADDDQRLVFGELHVFDVERGIHDPSWKRAEPEPVVSDDRQGSFW